MAKKPTYEELEQRVKELEQETREYKQTEKVMRESEERYRNILYSAGEGILVIQDGIIKLINRRMLEIVGYSPRDMDLLSNEQFLNFIHPEDQDLVADRYYRRLKGEKLPSTYSVRLIRSNGESLWVDLSPTSISWEGKSAILTFVTDITERKQTEAALQESEERYKLLFNKAPLGITLILDNSIRFFNKSAMDLVNYSYEELDQEMGDNFFEFIHPEDRTMIAERYAKRIEGEELQPPPPVRILTKDGEIKWVYFYSHPIPWEGKQGLLVHLIDITQQKKAEEEKQRLLQQLHQAQKMEAIGTLAGGVAHDLNNVLAGLVSYPELLLTSLPQDSHLRKPILTIQKSGEKAATIVQDLLTLARRGVAVTEVVNLNDIISEYLKSPENQRLEFHHPGVTIECNLETDLLNVLGSPVHLAKTVMNLVSNGVEAVLNEGKVIISTENRYIDSPVRGYDDVEEGDYVALKVSDTGVGISSEDMQRIFDPFYTKKVMGRSGTGLGMAVVWGTVKDHNGYIDLESTKGKGTTFTLYFPVTRQEISKQKPISIEDYMGNGESILIVDDVEEQREIASHMLMKLGYSVTSVSNGKEAIDYLKDNSVDLLLLDMIMEPGIDGLETYKRIIELHPGQRAIIGSGFSETDRVKEAQRLGAGKYVKKPFTLEKLGLAVKEELEK